MTERPIEVTRKKIFECQKIVITSHLRPDGDSLCTGLALYFIIRQLGKKADIINYDRTPAPFNQFPHMDVIKIGEIPPNYYDCVILLECANVSRSGHRTLDNYFKINIDHHHSNDYYADINWVDPEASAVAELVYDLAVKLHIEFTPEIANNLYCAIVSDTGSFQFSNTNARSFEVCSNLVKKGADPISVSQFLFNNNPLEKIKLLGKVLSTLQLKENGKIALISLFQKDLAILNQNEIDTEDITSLARSIIGVQVVLFFKEIRANVFRISVRSKGEANAAAIAEHFGGGGHVHAAGFTVKGRFTNLTEEIPRIINSLFLSKQSSPEKAS
ncbi:MAG: DHH family phosphoesterase [Acidobacteriota bacterium]